MENALNKWFTKYPRSKGLIKEVLDNAILATGYSADFVHMIIKSILLVFGTSTLIVMLAPIVAYPGMLAGVLADMTLHTGMGFTAGYTAVSMALLILAEVLATSACILNMGKRVVANMGGELTTDEQLERIADELTEIRTRLGEG